MPFLKPQWPALAGAAASTIVLTLVELAKPWPLALALDKIVRSRKQPFHLSASDVRLLLIVVALVVAISLAEAVADYFSDLWLYTPASGSPTRCGSRPTSICSGFRLAITSERPRATWSRA